jgi:4-diphosphocytidyl-2C-methyl-D-erythritol kinase
MSGSGSTTFALASSTAAAEQLAEQFQAKFGANNWIAVVPVQGNRSFNRVPQQE